MQQVDCDMEGAPDYTVMIPKAVGCTLVGREMGSKIQRVNLVFYDGWHFALGMSFLEGISIVAEYLEPTLRAMKPYDRGPIFTDYSRRSMTWL